MQLVCPSVQFSSVAQSCPTPCDPMNCSTRGLPVHHKLLEPEEFLFQYPIILSFHTVHGVLKARILKWFAIPFSSGPHSVCPYFLFILGLVVGKHTFLRICAFLLGCPLHWHTVAHSSLIILCISVESMVTSHFSYLILLILGPFPFFLDEFGYRFINFILSNNQLLVSVIFAIAFLVSVSYISTPIFIVSFLH